MVIKDRDMGSNERKRKLFFYSKTYKMHNISNLFYFGHTGSVAAC